MPKTLLLLFTLFVSSNLLAQSVFNNPTTQLVEKLLNEHHAVTKGSFNHYNNQSTVEIAASAITNEAKDSYFLIYQNHPQIEWEWNWTQIFDQDQSYAASRYQEMIKQLSNSIIHIHQNKKSAVLHIRSSSVNNQNKVYFELLPVVDNVMVMLELKFDQVWKIEMKVQQIKNRNQYVMN